MAHEIESMFYVGAVPWHELGTKLETAPTTREAIVAAGLDWSVDCKPLFTAEGERVSHRAMYRTDTGATLGVVGPDYTPLQNASAFEWFDPIVTAGGAKLEAAGSLREGRRIWILAQLDADPSVIVKQSDDVVRKYVLLSNSHDGKLAVRVGFTPIRVVCANTLAMAHNDSSSRLLRVVHTSSVEDTLVKVREAMNLANASFEATADQYRALAACDIKEGDLRRYVAQVFSPKLLAAKQAKANLIANVNAMINGGYSPEVSEEETKSIVLPKVQNLFETGRGAQLPGVRGTMWAAYNAVNEYIGYERGVSVKDDDRATKSNRLDSLWFGTGAALNRRALSVATEMAMAA